MPTRSARRLLVEVRRNLALLEPLFQRGRESAFAASASPLQPLYDAAAALEVAALESVLAELMAVEDGGEDLWVPAMPAAAAAPAWNDGARLRHLYVRLIAARAETAAHRAGKTSEVDIAERLRGLRRDCQQLQGLLAAEVGDAGWRDVAGRVLQFIVPRRTPAAPGSLRSAA